MKCCDVTKAQSVFSLKTDETALLASAIKWLISVNIKGVSLS